MDRSLSRWLRVALLLFGVGLALAFSFVTAHRAHAAVGCTIFGTTGNDHLNGTAGDDVICGLGGNDSIVGLGGNDTLLGGDGNDTLVGGRGNDTLDGGTGLDTAGFYDSKVTGTVTVDLTTGVATNGVLGTDTIVFDTGLSTIENVEAGPGNDVIMGDGQGNTLSGRQGNDTIHGGLGNDRLNGNTGADQLFGEDGNDLIQPGADADPQVQGGPGYDQIRYGDDATGVTVDIVANTTAGGAGGDVISGFESLTGSSHDDVLKAQSAGTAMQIRGLDGNDMLFTDDTTGGDRTDGGNGVDHCITDPSLDVGTSCAPTAIDESFTAVGNTQLAVGVAGTAPNVALAGSVLTNDYDMDGDALSAGPGAIVSANGGSVAMNADGSFTYLPAAGFSGLDPFEYTVTAGGETDTGTVTVTVGTVVWYVDDSAAAGGTGRSNAPYNALSSLQGGGDLDDPADVIFLYSGTYPGGLPLEATQSLIGEPQGLTVDTHALVTAGGTNPVIQNAAGTAVTLAEGNTLRRINIGTSSGDGISGTSVNAADIGGSSSISGVAGTDFKLSGGNGTVAFGATVTNTAGRAVDIQSRTGGTVTISGSVSDSAGTGILLNSNTGATVAFSGGVTLSTGSAKAFTATAGGIVTVAGSSNTLATTTGIALDVESTTIGAAGMTFQSIASNGAAAGIILRSTGATAGLTVTGVGSTADSGGIIQNCTGSGLAFTTQPAAVFLESTKDVSLANVKIQNNTRNGLYGTNVTGFTLTNSKLLTNATNALSPGNDEAGLKFDNLLGTGTLTTVEVSGSSENNASIVNTSGTLNPLTITGSSFHDNDIAGLLGNDGLYLEARGTGATAASITASISTTSFTNNYAKGLQVHTNQNGSMNVTVNGGTYTNDSTALQVAHNSTGSFLFNISNISATGSFSRPGATVVIFAAGSGSGVGQEMKGRFGPGNVVVGAGSGNSDALLVQAIESSQLIALIGDTDANAANNNTFSNSDRDAIEALANQGTSHMDVTIKNNAGSVLSSAYEAIYVASGDDLATDANTVCANLAGNTTTHPTSADLTLDQHHSSSPFKLQGYAGSATDDTAVATFVNGLNPGTTAQAFHTSPGFTSATCLLPP